MVAQVLFSSVSTEWETPPNLYNRWDKKYNFELDVCAQAHNAKCKNYFSPEDDGLAQDWGNKVCWMNPPYGRNIILWVRKAFMASQQGATVVCLLPSRTDTRWFHDYAIHGKLYFIRGRIRFVGGACAAPFPSVVVVFEPPTKRSDLCLP